MARLTTEGSIAYSSLLSVIETCRLRQINRREYLSSVIKLARQGPSSASNFNGDLNLHFHLLPILLTLFLS